MIRSEDGKSIQQFIQSSFTGMSLEQYLKKEMQLSKAQIRSLKFRENGLQVNGERVRVSYTLKENDLLEILLEEKKCASDHLEETEGELEILYEDDDLIAVWKDAGLVVHPSHGHYKDTLSNRIYTYFNKQNKHVMVRSIGRLDRDTSGILVFAKNQVAAAKLWKQKEEGVFCKEYLAVCRGKIRTEEILQKYHSVIAERNSDDQNIEKTTGTDENKDRWYTIHAPIDVMSGELMKMCVAPTGKEAVTHFQIIRYDEASDRTLVRVRIDTGRMHQIRVHMAYIGYPLAGDILYDVYAETMEKQSSDISAEKTEKRSSDIPAKITKKQLSEMFLCAWKAELYQPFTGEKIILYRDSEVLLK